MAGAMAPALSVLCLSRATDHHLELLSRVALETCTDLRLQNPLQVSNITVLCMAGSPPRFTLSLAPRTTAQRKESMGSGFARIETSTPGKGLKDPFGPSISCLVRTQHLSFHRLQVRYLDPVRPGQNHKISNSLASQVPDHRPTSF